MPDYRFQYLSVSGRVALLFVFQQGVDRPLDSIVDVSLCVASFDNLPHCSLERVQTSITHRRAMSLVTSAPLRVTLKRTCVEGFLQLIEAGEFERQRVLPVLSVITESAQMASFTRARSCAASWRSHARSGQRCVGE